MRAAHQNRHQLLSQTTTTTTAAQGQGQGQGQGRRLTTVTVMAETPAYEMQQLASSASSTAAAANTERYLPRQPSSVTGTTGEPSTRATLMLIIVVGVFLLVEVPLSGRPRRRSSRGSAAVCPAAARHRRKHVPRRPVQRHYTLHCSAVR